MSKVTKKELQRAIQRQESRIDGLVGLLAKKGYYDKEPEPQLRQLDQSIFDGLDEKWRFAAVDDDGLAYAFMRKPVIDQDSSCFIDGDTTRCSWIGKGYDTSNWQNSLIERDIAKEPLEVDLSSELTGSELCRAMLERGDKYVMCLVFDDTRNLDATYVIRGYHDGYFHTTRNPWENAIPINNQGEPLTAAEAGL